MAYLESNVDCLRTAEYRTVIVEELLREMKHQFTIVTLTKIIAE